MVSRYGDAVVERKPKRGGGLVHELPLADVHRQYPPRDHHQAPHWTPVYALTDRASIIFQNCVAAADNLEIDCGPCVGVLARD